MKRASKRLWKLCLLAPLLGCPRETPVAEVPPVEVVVCQPIKETVEGWDLYTGTVESKESVEIRSRVRGEIKEVRFKEGEEIPAGTDMFLIDDGPFQADLSKAKGELTTWEAKQQLAEERVALYKPLAEKGSVSKEELLKAVSDRGEAVGGIAGAKGKILEAELNIGYCRISSPIAGKVGEAKFTKGNMVTGTGTDSVLARVVAIDPMYVYFNVNERALLNYRKLLGEQAAKTAGAMKEAAAKIPVELGLAAGTDYPFMGIIDFVDNRVDPATSSIKVRARFDNPKGADGNRALTSGLFARIRVRVTQPYQGIMVADRAILADQSLKYVLTVDKSKKNEVKRMDVETSNRVEESGLREVQGGLKGDEWIVVEGVNRTRPGATVEPKDGPMPRRPTKKRP